MTGAEIGSAFQARLEKVKASLAELEKKWDVSFARERLQLVREAHSRANFLTYELHKLEKAVDR